MYISILLFFKQICRGHRQTVIIFYCIIETLLNCPLYYFILPLFLKVGITVHFQYFLRMEELVLLHDTFDLDYKGVIEKSAVDAMKVFVNFAVTNIVIPHENCV